MGKRIPAYIKDWRLHGLIVCIVVIAEWIGPITFSLGAGTLLLLPMVFSFLFGLGSLLSPIVSKKQFKHAEMMAHTAICLLIAKLSLTIGPALDLIFQMGPALLIQEIGNLGTVLIGLPLALLLGLKREAIGMTHSIAREGNVALINDKYGFDAPETRGVMAIYIYGTVFGALFLGMITSLLASFTPLHPFSLAMATGVGSASMMAASSGSLIALYPDLATEITSIAASSNMLSAATGIYFSIFIALPLTETLYKLYESKKNKQVFSSARQRKEVR